MRSFWEFQGYVCDPRDLTAISPEMMRQHELAQSAAAMQYRPTLSDMNALRNLSRQPLVPKGWAEWSAYGTTY
jgi:hypothetical protein